MRRTLHIILTSVLAVFWLVATPLLITFLVLYGPRKAYGHKQCADRILEHSIIGYADLYGVGFRVSVYTQWIALVLSACKGSDHGEALAATSLIFNFAFTIAFYVMSFEDQCFTSVDVIIVTQMLHAGIYISLISTFWDLCRGLYRNTTYVSAFLFTLMGPVVSYNWAMFALYGDINYAASPDKTRFIFNKDGSPGPWGAHAWVVFVVALWMFIHPVLFLVRRFLDLVFRQNVREVKPVKPRTFLYKFLVMLFGFGAIGFTIANIEITLIWNNVTDVNRVDPPGQLVPLLGTVVATVFAFGDFDIKAVLFWREPQGDEPAHRDDGIELLSRRLRPDIDKGPVVLQVDLEVARGGV